MTIGFIGLGKMGLPMAKKILAAGYDLVVFDTSAEPLQEMEKNKVRVAESPAMLGKYAERIILMLPNSQIVQNVVGGEQGLLSSLKEQSIVIDMSTSNPLSTKALAPDIEHQGAILLDAPVSGGVHKAEDGSLTIMVGGDEDRYLDILPLLKTMGTHIVHVGPLGSGHTIKVLNNMLSATHFLATVEILSAGMSMNIRPDKMLEVINTSTGRNLSSEHKVPNFVLNRKFDSNFSMDLMCKDVSIAVDLINELKSPAFLPGIVSQVWNLANAKGKKGYDHTEIVRLYEDWMDKKMTSDS